MFTIIHDNDSDDDDEQKSNGHIGVLFKTEKLILSYHYGIADVLFIPILIDVGLF